MNKQAMSLIIGGAVFLLLLSIGSRFWKSVPAGHVAVATLFGDVVDKPFEEGLHIPVNPLYDWHMYDVRQKSHKESAAVPSQDQLQTRLDVSIQYRLIRAQTPKILANTGTLNDVLNVHLVPKLRSILREQGKTVKQAEDFFKEETQNRLQVAVLSGLRDFLTPKGVNVTAVLIRDINLPPFILKAIESKKEREQAVQKQKAELERYRTEQQQKVAAAIAERAAAEQNAAKRRILADVQAYEIEKINKAIGKNPNYVKLKALQALEAISKDPAAKVYFINGDSPQPLPLLHMGDSKH